MTYTTNGNNLAGHDKQLHNRLGCTVNIAVSIRCITIKKLGSFLAPLVAAAALTVPAKASVIDQYSPDYTISPGRVELPIEITNNDNGAVYNSFDLVLFNTLANGLYGLSHNQANYTSIEDMTSEWVLSIRPNPIGEVNNKWFVDTSSYDPAEIYHSGLGYEQWQASQQNQNQDMMALALSIPLSQLDGNANGWSGTDPQDYFITMNTTPTPGMGVGREGITSYNAQGYEYNVNIVPEPSTIGLMLLGLAALYGSKRKEE
jgi:hypothetical protein